jgi:hypothetical protein
MVDAAKLRQALSTFLGADWFRGSVQRLWEKGRLRFWQERVWERFVRAHPEFAVGENERAVALRVCWVHGEELQQDAVDIVESDCYVRPYRAAFPFAASGPVYVEGAPFSHRAATVWFCPQCRKGAAEWHARQAALARTLLQEDLTASSSGALSGAAMKCDMDLVRKILLQAENADGAPDFSALKAEYGENAFSYHERLVLQAHLVAPVIMECGYGRLPDGISRIKELTWEGHQFIAVARNDALWAKAKERVHNVLGGLTMDALRAGLKKVSEEAMAAGLDAG